MNKQQDTISNNPINKQQDTIENNPIAEVKKDWRRDNLATRIDLRMPNEVYDRVIEIAIASGEKINPKTGQVRVTATLNKLIEIGIRYYPEDNLISSDNIRQLSDAKGLEEKYQELSDKYRELESIASDTNPILSEIRQDIVGLKSFNVEGIARTSIDVVIQPLTESVEELRSELAEVSEFARNLQGEIVKVKKLMANAQAQPQGNCVNANTTAIVESISQPIDTAENILGQQNESTTSVNNDWDEHLAKLVETGMRSTGIAQKLTEMGYKNSKGGEIDRKSVERRIDRLPELKELYRKAKPE